MLQQAIDWSQLKKLPGVGPQTIKQLQSLGYTNYMDLVLNIPRRYEDKTRIIPIRQVRYDDTVQVQGAISQVEWVRGKKPRLVLDVEDDTGCLQVTFFHFSAKQYHGFKEQSYIRCFGQVRFGILGKSMVHPTYKLLSQWRVDDLPSELDPVYSQIGQISQKIWRRIIDWVLTAILPQVRELLVAHDDIPSSSFSLAQALQNLHHPQRDQVTSDELPEQTLAYQRLCFEEMLAFQIGMLQARLSVRQLSTYPCASDNQLGQRLLSSLPFELTQAQKRALGEIYYDLIKAKPMMRLLQGDVGSGKTVVAIWAALQAITQGYQVALMAPTEVLAEQHYHNIKAWLDSLCVRVELLTGRQTRSKRRALEQAIADGELAMVVGTHALFQASVQFRHLALVIIDEQHRFGVEQRLALRNKGEVDDRQPHQLIMTATPIPRTLCMSLYADLDSSVIGELPPNRQPVDTKALPEHRRDEVLARVEKRSQQGWQTYWVCPLIEQSEQLSQQAAEQTYEWVKAAFKDTNQVGMIHGRMAAKDKQNVMQRFKQGEIKVLVATTVIEVGVDVPNANLIVIENAQRFGLAQLHQLRGRVGRGQQKSYCLLLYESPLSEVGSERIKAMRESSSGFYLAQKDLELRGAGEVLGQRQTGGMDFRIAQLVRDKEWLPVINKMAGHLLKSDPQTAQALVQRWFPGANEYIYT